jgi:hypothetical protein
MHEMSTSAAVGDGIDAAAGGIGAERDTALGTESGTSVVSSCQEMSMKLLSPSRARKTRDEREATISGDPGAVGTGSGTTFGAGSGTAVGFRSGKNASAGSGTAVGTGGGMRVGAGRGTGVGSFYAVGAGVGAVVGDGVDTAAGDIGAERDTAFGTESGTSVVSSCQEMSMELLSPSRSGDPGAVGTGSGTTFGAGSGTAVGSRSGKNASAGSGTAVGTGGGIRVGAGRGTGVGSFSQCTR